MKASAPVRVYGIAPKIVPVAVTSALAILAAENVTPSRYLYYAARGLIGFCRSVPDLVWALLFVTAVGLGPFPGALALSVHSIGMLGRLFAETIEHMDMAPIDALALTGARDMSTIQTPPHDRLPVQTIVTQYDERIIREQFDPT